jgi:hypothetical protein
MGTTEGCYFAFARFYSITGEVICYPSLEINAEATISPLNDSPTLCPLGFRPKEGIAILSCVAPQNPTYAPWQEKDDIDRV